MHLRSVLILLVLLGGEIFVSAQTNAPSLGAIRAAAEKGDAVAQNQLAWTFIVKSDYAQAEVWFRKAAAQNYPPACGMLGELFLKRTKMDTGTTEEQKALGAEAVKWATLAANLGDKRGQSDMANILLEGKLTKQDLIEAYKWGELASHGPTNETATMNGASMRDAALLKMLPVQITEAKKRVAAFVPHLAKIEEVPDPAWEGQVKVTGLSGAPGHRLAMLNGRTFEQGEKGEVKANGKVIQVHCLEIRDNSVVLDIEGFKKPIEILFNGK